MTDSKDQEQDIDVLLINRTKKMIILSYCVKILVLVGAAGASIAQFIQTDPTKPVTSAQYLGILCSIIVFLAGLFIVILDNDSVNEIIIAKTQKKKYEELASNLGDLEIIISNISRHTNIYQSVMLMRKVIESWDFHSLDIDMLSVEFLKWSNVSLRQSMKFTAGDQGTICIYRAEAGVDGKMKMRLVAHWRELSCEVSEARVWDEGVGIAGISYSNQVPIIISDLEEGDLKTVFGGNTKMSRPYDAERYRSMVAIPIEVREVDKPWGVVTASNNRPHHFSHEASPGLKTDEGVRALAHMVALGVSIKRKYDNRDDV